MHDINLNTCFSPCPFNTYGQDCNGNELNYFIVQSAVADASTVLPLAISYAQNAIRMKTLTMAVVVSARVSMATTSIVLFKILKNAMNSASLAMTPLPNAVTVQTLLKTLQANCV